MAMYFKRLSPCKNLFSLLNQQVRSFARDPFPNKLTQYLHQAKLIDSIRLALRSGSPNSINPLLQHRLLDSLVVTNALRSAPSVDSAVSLMENLNQVPNFEHSHNTIFAYATVLAKFQRTKELKAFIGDIFKGGKFKFCKVSFMNLLFWYSTAGDLDEVLTTYEQYKSEEKRLSAEAYNIVIGAYAQKGMNSEAVEVFRGMIDNGAIPNSRTYTILLEHLVRLGKLDAAMEVFTLLPSMRIKRTLKHFSVLIEGFAGAKRFDMVKSVLKEMTEDGKFPGRRMRVYLEQMKEAGYIDETDEFLAEMSPDERIKSISACEDSGDEDEDNDDDMDEGVDCHMVKLKPWLDPKALAHALKEWSPEVVAVLEGAKFVWTTRLVCKVLRHFKSPETAWNFFCWVAFQPGFTHDLYSVQRMMTLLARHGNVELVDKLINKVRREEMRLPFSSLRLLIEFYGNSKNADAALKVFREDRTLCGPISKFNLTLLYSSLLRAIVKCRRNTDVLDVLDEMILNGVCPDIQTFSGLIYHFARQGDIRTVQLLCSMVKQNGMELEAYMYKLLIEAYCKSQRAPLALRVFEDMRNSNLMPDAATKDLLVKSLWEEGRRKEAAAVEESFKDTNGVLPLALRGQLWTLSSEDLSRVYSIYSNSVRATA